MKQAFVLLLSTLLGAAPAFGQTVLKISLSDKTAIKVAVDGRYFNKRGETVTVADLPQGRHYLKIFALNTTRRGTQIDEVIYEGKIKTYRGQLTMFIYDPNTGTANVSEQDIDYNAAQAESFNNRNLNNYDTKGNNNQGDNNAAPSQPENTTTNNALPEGTPLASPVSAADELDAIEKGKTVKENKPAKTAKAVKPLKDPKLEKARKKVTAKTTDTDKLAAAKLALKNEKLSTAQIITVISWFNFENSKVDFAKWAYPDATDKEKYGKIKAKLTMKSYREEMDKFLKSNK
jgi:hypothetical protein